MYIYIYTEMGSNEVQVTKYCNEVHIFSICTLLSIYFSEYFLLLSVTFLTQVSVLLLLTFAKQAGRYSLLLC